MKHSLFAVQIFTRLAESGDLRRDLHELIAAAPERVTHVGKHRFYGDLVRLVQRRRPEIPLGHWDYTSDPEEAEREFHEWSEGTIRDATEMASHSPDPNQERFMFLTVAVLVERKSTTDRALEKACAIPEADLWKRATFDKLLQAFGNLDWRRVRSDVVFLCPGNLERGVTRADLTKPAYAYVNTLTA